MKSPNTQEAGDPTQAVPVDWQALAISRYERMEEYRVQRDELLESLKFLFGEMESGNLVRDIKRDGDPDWAMRMMTFTMKLGKAQVAIMNAEGKTDCV